MDSYSVQVTDFYDKQSLIWLGSVTLLHDYNSGDPENLWVNHTITRQLTDIDYVGENPHEDDFDDYGPYNIWKDPMLWVAFGVVGGIVVGFGILVHVVRKRSREWQLAEIARFEAEKDGKPSLQTNGEST